MSTIESTIREFLRDYLYLADVDSLSGGDSFLEKGIVDSMGIIHLIEFVERQYAIQVKDQDLVTDNWDSIDRMSRYIRNRLSETEPITVHPESAVALDRAQ